MRTIAIALAAVLLGGCGAAVKTDPKPMTLARFDGLRLGESRLQITNQFGLPESREKVVPYGFLDEEPRGLRCIYYPRPSFDTGAPWSTSDTFQLCFHRARLRYKWAYIAARA